MKTERFKKLSDKQKKLLYKQDYERQKKTMKVFAIKCAYSTNFHIIKKLEEQDNVAQYIKNLIEKDITEEEFERFKKEQEQDLALIREQKKK